MGKMDVLIDRTFDDLCIKELFPYSYIHFLDRWAQFACSSSPDYWTSFTPD